jgi:hypothetical protein
MTPPARLHRWEKAGLAAFGLLVIGFGAITEIRGAFQATRKTDAGVYLRAAWAARSGHDVYAVTDDNGWHYSYPPTFALFLAPLADPMPGQPRDGYPPYWLSVALWYAFGVLCVGWAVHVLACAVLPGDAFGTRRWWYARTIPVYVCLGGIGHTLGRGQVNVLVVALVASSFAALVAGRRVRSGLWLAAAVVLKVFPAYLLVFPFVRRDGRALAGAAAGLVVLLGVIPALWWGVDGMIDANRKVVELVIRPGTTGEGDQTRAKELTGTTSTDSQSFQALIHATLHPDPQTRPAEASRETRLAHWALGGLLTLVTAWLGWRRFPPSPLMGEGLGVRGLSFAGFPSPGGAAPPPSPARGEGIIAADQLVYLGCLCSLMLLVSPVSHMHYYAFSLPLVAGLWLRSMAARPGAVVADARTTAVLVVWGVATALPLFPGGLFDRLREGGFGVAATVGLWAFGLRTVIRPAVASLPVAGPASRSPVSRAA